MLLPFQSNVYQTVKTVREVVPTLSSFLVRVRIKNSAKKQSFQCEKVTFILKKISAIKKQK